MMIIDNAARMSALDPSSSFIVQAPAGAGKTELLTQRFLALLGNVQEQPEEILAVTFTKKAAGEMRNRIVNALIQARAQEVAPEKPHEKATWVLAKAALAKNDKNEWQLVENPNRLRIVTIDAFCASLVNKMPILSQFGGDFMVIEYATALYEQAAKALISQTTENEPWTQSLETLLLHLDNRMDKIVGLLVTLLMQRDQWLPYLRYLSANEVELQAYFEQSIQRLIENHLQKVNALFSASIASTLMKLVNEAAKNCEALEKQNKIVNLVNQTQLPGTFAHDLLLWQGIAEVLLTKEGEFRKRFDQNIGFLSQSAAKDKVEKAARKEQQETIKVLIAELAEIEGAQNLLAELELLPEPHLSNQHLKILKALGDILPVLVAHLQVIFQNNGKVDFTEISLRASNALGDALEPSDILLKLDYQLRHILIDEYQDTSVSQYRLFEKLVAGWQPGDGRTLFLVGDPMQSIYRFRGAEVSLFLHTQEKGLGSVRLTPLTLQVNFRSNENVIHWINHVFKDIFPLVTNKTFGGVTYSPAIAAKTVEKRQDVMLVPIQKGRNDIAEVAVQKIMDSLTQNPAHTIAVLGRTRKDLSAVVGALKKLNIPFVAHEIEHLALRSHVVDLVSLLRATLDWTDKIAWYAILRAPWLGLTLSDIFALSTANPSGILWDAIQQFEQCQTLSTQAKERLSIFVAQMRYWLDNRWRKPLHEWLRGLWLTLGGENSYAHPVLTDMDAVFELICHMQESGIMLDIDAFEERLSQLYADVSVMQENAQQLPVELLTLHKAKGLEFDTVIIPYLQKLPKRNDPALLRWFEYTLGNRVDLLLAPYRFVAQEYDALYRYVDHCLTQKDRFEMARLLYVGATRAKNRLYLLGEYEVTDKGEIKSPPKGSFWEMLWPYVEQDFLHEHDDDTPKLGLNYEPNEKPLHRLKKPFSMPMLKEQDLALADGDLNRPPMSDYVARCAGTVFHRLLQRLTEEESSNQPDVLKVCELALKRMGLIGQELAQACTLIRDALHNMLNDEKGRWILDPRHQERQREWALSVKTTYGVENYVIDFSFVDENGIRWIIDYKLTHHQSFTGSTLAEETTRYRPQLLKYRQLLSRLEPRSIRCGLYFPLAKVFTEIDMVC